MRMTTAHCTPVGASKLFVEGGRGVAGGGGRGRWRVWLVEGVAVGVWPVEGVAGGGVAGGGCGCGVWLVGGARLVEKAAHP